MTTHNATLKKLRIFESLYSHGYRSDVIGWAVDKLIAVESHNALRESAEINARLRQFESQYGMASKEFYERFQRGELGDSADFFEWRACYDMERSVHERLQDLQTERS